MTPRACLDRFSSPRRLFLLLVVLATAYYAFWQESFLLNSNDNAADWPEVDSHKPKKAQWPSFKFVWDDNGETAPNHDSSTDTASSDKSPDTPPPQIVWLASYPNSGTSYTMTMVERSTNLSTATNYGVEIATRDKDDSIPVHAHYPQGPFWEGLSGQRGTTIRHLPRTFVLTKTHCGGRCIKCFAADYVVNATEFVQACQKTSAYHTINGRPGVRFYGSIEPDRIARVVHLIRNPFHNIVARYHLERRHLVQKVEAMAARFPNNAIGFARWCRYLDEKYVSKDDAQVLPSNILKLMESVPCRAEFFKYVQWHNRLIEILPLLGNTHSDQNDVLVIHYEDYEHDLNTTVHKLMNFLQQDTVKPVRPFRELPTYADHYSAEQRQAARALVQALATPRTWELIRHYF